MKKLKNIFFFTIILLLLLFVYFVTYTFVEPKAYDFMTSHVLTEKLPFDREKYVYGSGDIVLIVIDEETAERYRWPWKRELFCKIFDYLKDYSSPRIVVHDSFMSSLDTDNPESDKKFFNCIRRFDNLVEGFMPIISLEEKTKQEEAYDKKFAKKFALKNIENTAKYVPHIYNSTIPFPEPFFDSVKKVGSVTVFSGFVDGNFLADEIIRTQELIIDYEGNLYPSLAMQTFLEFYRPEKIVLNDHSIEIPELKYTISQKQTKYHWVIPIKFYKLFGNGFSHLKYSALDIMDSYDAISAGKKPKINPEIFNDKIVVIGANVPASDGLLDSKNTALIMNHPGVDIQATAIDNVIHNDFLKNVPVWINIIVMLLVMLFVYFSIKVNEIYKALFLTFSAIVIYLLTVAICFYYSIIVLVITPVVMFIATMIVAYIHRYLIESTNKQKVENALGKYMSEDVMKRVIQNIDNLGLGGKKAEVTVLFSDIRGFTSMSEKMSAEEVTEILNEYFSEMEPIVKKYNGIINKFIGDAIMAIFGEPIQDENHASNAVKCGYEMLKKVEELDKKWENEGKPKIEIGIGINTGEAFVGNIGSENRMEYTVIGDTVNLASRLESYNKTFNSKMLISSTTYDVSKEIIEARKISDVEVRGKAEKLDVYEVLSVI